VEGGRTLNEKMTVIAHRGRGSVSKKRTTSLESFPQWEKENVGVGGGGVCIKTWGFRLLGECRRVGRGGAHVRNLREGADRHTIG